MQQRQMSSRLLPTSPPCFLLKLPPPHQQWRPPPPPPPLPRTRYTRTSYTASNTSSPFHRQVQTRYRRWDSNAETFRFQNFDFNPNSDSEYEYEDEEDDDEEDTSGVLEEFIDSIWIFKVFRSFGWMLPAIILSLLLATGPKAFLLALALPLGQSAISFVFQKAWGTTQRRPKRKARTKKKPRGPMKSKYNVKEKEGQRTRKRSTEYQSWVHSNDVPHDKGSQTSPSFGGWDELDRRTRLNTGPTRRSFQTTDEPGRTQKSKLSRRERRSGAPLLLRLLIAVFPFLGSWTKML